MGNDDKKGGIVLENFNSTANLTSNPGFISMLSLRSENVAEKSYNPFEHRNVKHPTSSFGSLVHLLKASLGSGILAMPAAFKNAGLATGAIGTVIVGFICTHCVHILVKTSQELCVDAKKPLMGFAETCGAAFTYGPKKLQPWANFAKTWADYVMAFTYLATLCVYVVFVAENFKKIFDVHFPENKLSAGTYCALTLIPLIPMCQIRRLKWLVPFSAIANVFLVLCFSITMYYILTDIPKPEERAMVAPVTQWPLFISTVIFAMEGIGVVMPVENEMSKPQQFLGCPGVLNIAMSIVIALYGIVGFTGYLKYGHDVRGSVTLSLPQNDYLAQSAALLMALAILFTYSLQFYVPMEMIWRKLNPKISEKYHNIAQIAIRIGIVFFSVALAASFPDLELVINLCGAIFLSNIGLLTPAVVETVHRWDRGLGPLNYIIWKNLFIAILSFIALFTGSYVAITNMIARYQDIPESTMVSNVTDLN